MNPGFLSLPAFRSLGIRRGKRDNLLLMANNDLASKWNTAVSHSMLALMEAAGALAAPDEVVPSTGSFQFMKPVRQGEEMEARPVVLKAGRKFVYTRIDIYVGDEIRATGNFTYVRVDKV